MANAQVNDLSLYLGYPCSVDAGVDPVTYTDMIIRRINTSAAAAAELRSGLCKLIPGCDTSSSDEELARNAAELRKSWGHAVHEDKTMMKNDMKDIAKFSEKMNFKENSVNKVLKLKVIEEFQNERIGDVRAFLTCIPVPQNDIIRYLYLCGHGLSDEVARELRHNPADDESAKSLVWPWELCSCRETMSRTPSVITGNARTGDIVVFSSGLLTPEWVVEKLREYEKSSNRVHNTIIIVIDACYSGTWITRIRECLKVKEQEKQKLQCTRVIVQTSCSENEVSYGGCFTPVFCALQDPKKRIELWRLHKEDKDTMEEVRLFCEQTPTFYDSKRDQELPNSFYFIDDVEFFNFCRKYFAIENGNISRSIPTKEYSQFFASFSPGHPDRPKTHCFRLNRMKKNGSPLAFFLIEWKQKKYHIHLHFDNFKYMKLTGVTHVDVIGKEYNEDSEDPKYTEDSQDPKKHITGADQTAWFKYVKSNETAIIEYFKNFVQQYGKQWNNESFWNMQKALPENLIRSRSACLEKCIAMEKFKSVASN